MFRLMVHILLIMALIFQSSCRTIEVRYETVAKIRGSYYSVTSHTELRTDRLFWACWTTIYVYGGLCLYYLALPDSYDKQLAEFDLTLKLSEKFPNSEILLAKNGDISRLFEDFDPEITLNKIPRSGNNTFKDIYKFAVPEQRSFVALLSGFIIVAIVTIAAFTSPLAAAFLGPPIGVGGIGLLTSSFKNRVVRPED